MSVEAPDKKSDTPEEFRVKEKRYYSNSPFTTIFVMMGPGICEPRSFSNHQMDTDHKLVQAYLDPLIDRPGSGIVSVGRDEIEKIVNQAAADARTAGEQAHKRAVAAGLSTT